MNQPGVGPATCVILAVLLGLALTLHPATARAQDDDKSTWPVIVDPAQHGDPLNAVALACRDASVTRAEYGACLTDAGIMVVFTPEEAQAALAEARAIREATQPTQATVPMPDSSVALALPIGQPPGRRCDFGPCEQLPPFQWQPAFANCQWSAIEGGIHSFCGQIQPTVQILCDWSLKSEIRPGMAQWNTTCQQYSYTYGNGVYVCEVLLSDATAVQTWRCNGASAGRMVKWSGSSRR